MPADLRQAIVAACRETETDSDEAIARVEELVGDDQYLDHSVWTGPGLDTPTVLVDIFVIGSEAIYNHAYYTGMATSSMTFLEGLTNVTVVSGLEGPSETMLRYEFGERRGSIFGHKQDLPKLQTMRRRLIEARAAVADRRR